MNSKFLKTGVFIFCLGFTMNALAQIYGCTDPLASNYNSSASDNDGSCIYVPSSVSPGSTMVLPANLDESSGLIEWNNRIWTHNDDSDLSLYSIDPADVSDIYSYALTGTINLDWEEISQDADYIYIGDVGNNQNGNRHDLKILRVEKNSLLSNDPIMDTIFFTYSLQTDFTPAGSNNTNFDCEAFIVSADSIYLFTKEWISKKSSIYALSKHPGTHTAHYRNEYDVNGLITGATYMEAKRLIALCGYSSLLEPFFVLLYDFVDNSFFSGNKRKITVNSPFHQVEGIATKDGLSYYVSNEKFVQSIIAVDPKIQKIDLSIYLSNFLNMLTRNSDKIISKRILVYPNPTNSVLTVNTEDDLEGKPYSIIDVFGHVVLEGYLGPDHTSIDLENIGDGVYLLCIDRAMFQQIIRK